MTLESKSDITNAAESAREEELLASKMTHTPVRKTHRKLKIVLVAVLAVVVAGADRLRRLRGRLLSRG